MVRFNFVKVPSMLLIMCSTILIVESKHKLNVVHFGWRYLALRDLNLRYLSPIGSKAVMRTRSNSVTRDELFSLEDSVPQAAFVGFNGKYVSVKQGELQHLLSSCWLSLTLTKQHSSAFFVGAQEKRANSSLLLGISKIWHPHLIFERWRRKTLHLCWRSGGIGTKSCGPGKIWAHMWISDCKNLHRAFRRAQEQRGNPYLVTRVGMHVYIKTFY